VQGVGERLVSACGCVGIYVCLSVCECESECECVRVCVSERNLTQKSKDEMHMQYNSTDVDTVF
jgi:hypothetical protein